jgi:glutamate dehydrogenase
MHAEAAQTVVHDAIEPILAQLRGRVAAPRRRDAEQFARQFFRRVGPDELAVRGPEAWTALLLGLLEFLQIHQPGSAKVRVFNPSAEESGWDTGHTVVEVLTDDSAFLVDSVSMAIAGQGALVHAVIHPVLQVERDVGGHLLAIPDEADGSARGRAESVMHFEVDRRTEPGELVAMKLAVESALRDVRACVADWRAMRAMAERVAEELADRPLPVDQSAREEAQAFMRWLAGDHFTFLGYREYVVEARNGDEVLAPVADTGLGILRSDEPPAPRPIASLPGRAAGRHGITEVVIVTKTNARSTVHRPGHMDYISVLRFDEEGRAVGEQRFLGLFTSGAYACRPWDVPLVRHKYEGVMARSGFARDSHNWKALRHVLETLPRDELFQGSADELAEVAIGILRLSQRQRVRVFMRHDRYGRFHSVMVFLPRDRFNEDVRQRVEAVLMRALSGERVDSTIHVSESPLARMHLVVRGRPGGHLGLDLGRVEAEIAQIVRNWHDELRDLLVQRHGEDRGSRLANRYGRALPAGYIEAATPWVAASDVETAAALRGTDDLRLALYRSRKPGAEGRIGLKLFRFGSHLPLSDVLPMMENMGLRVLSEHPYELDLGGSGNIYMQDFEVAATRELDLDAVRDSFQQAFERIWSGDAENDGFNRLVLGAALDWRQVAVLRAYCKYLLQTGIPFSQSYMEETLARYPLHARLLVDLFEARFDPSRAASGRTQIEVGRKRLVRDLEWLLDDTLRRTHGELVETLAESRGEPREVQIQVAEAALASVMDQVHSLDEDRILRSWQALIRATLRTNHFQLRDGRPKAYLSLKLDPAQVPDLPKPRPYREIFVYGPRVEGVHLRFGPVARGGLRWSDRREDFRTEVLGLVKAQMVKNTVIVPVGAKGGFFVKRPPVEGGREAQLAEGVACYRMFIHGLLDITDNIHEGRIVKPADVVCHDADDPYLVVAADKGTATFSDIANSVSAEHGFWLGDAFASGGSNGYDHKDMGITAKGGWESVKRHFRALGRDSQSQDFTCVGIGDMSGDVFGNGMLLSRHIRLVAAFDHRHIFIDPNPDAAASYVERQRMFALPRSSWEDYDRALISAGGGVWARGAKSIPVSPEARAALGIEADVAQLTPSELINAILKAPVDLLWNGGIGTYVKAAGETHAEVGDRANNAIRVNGAELRCRIVGEGGNLGMTQLGRIEAAQHGVLLNTDFIDNSAGVDTSDHEVNIKILLDALVAGGVMDDRRRNALLREMTDEVESLVLRDNYLQNQAISLMQRMSRARLGAEQHFVQVLESQGLLDREIEYLPTDAEFAERKARGQGLTRPELAILLSYSKLVLFQQLVESDVPEDPHLSRELERYFPQALQSWGAEMRRHRLKREIIATAVTNSMVNRMGATFVMRMQEDTGESPGQIARAYAIAREVLDARGSWARIEALDGTIHDDAQMDAMQVVWALIRHATRWLLNAPGQRLDIAAAVTRYSPGIATVRGALATLVADGDRAAIVAREAHWLGLGFPDGLARELAVLPTLTSVFDVIEVAIETGAPVERAAKVHFALGEALHLAWLTQRIEELPVDGRWHAQARGTMRDELYTQQRALAAQVLRCDDGADPGVAVAAWLGREDPALRFTLAMLADMRSQAAMDYPTVSVAVRRLAQLAQAGARAV